MSRKARRRPSWGKHRQRFGKVVEYYGKTHVIFGDGVMEELLGELAKFKQQEPHYMVMSSQTMKDVLLHGMGFIKDGEPIDAKDVLI